MAQEAQHIVWHSEVFVPRCRAPWHRVLLEHVGHQLTLLRPGLARLLHRSTLPEGILANLEADGFGIRLYL